MILNTHTDAKTDTLSSTMNAQYANNGVSVRMLPEQWIEIEADLPGTGLETTGVRMRGRVLTLEAVRPSFNTHVAPNLGVDRVTTRVVLRDRPRGPVTATRRPSGSVLVRVPLRQPHVASDDAPHALDGLGGVAAEALMHARNHPEQQSYTSCQDTDVFPQRSGSVSAS